MQKRTQNKTALEKRTLEELVCAMADKIDITNPGWANSLPVKLKAYRDHLNARRRGRGDDDEALGEHQGGL